MAKLAISFVLFSLVAVAMASNFYGKNPYKEEGSMYRKGYDGLPYGKSAPKYGNGGYMKANYNGGYNGGYNGRDYGSDSGRGYGGDSGRDYGTGKGYSSNPYGPKYSLDG